MARSPLIIDGQEMGRLYLIDLGSGATLLMVEQEGEALSYPVGSDDARRIASFLRAAAGPATKGRPEGLPDPTLQSIVAGELERIAALYISDEAEAYEGSRQEYVVAQTGLTYNQATYRLQKARQAGVLAAKYTTQGKRIDG